MDIKNHEAAEYEKEVHPDMPEGKEISQKGFARYSRVDSSRMKENDKKGSYSPEDLQAIQSPCGFDRPFQDLMVTEKVWTCHADWMK
jgi:hypothetical protein